MAMFPRSLYKVRVRQIALTLLFLLILMYKCFHNFSCLCRNWMKSPKHNNPQILYNRLLWYVKQTFEFTFVCLFVYLNFILESLSQYFLMANPVFMRIGLLFTLAGCKSWLQGNNCDDMTPTDILYPLYQSRWNSLWLCACDVLCFKFIKLWNCTTFIST